MEQEGPVSRLSTVSYSGDPPYNVKISGHANAKGRHREFAMASGEMTEVAFRTFLEETLEACAAVSRSGAVHFVCMDWIFTVCSTRSRKFCLI
ncbi:hypothetical protein SuNHUV7_19860 (plasmid) [Pseudoseohaeicola sp. NH-UV-7]|uniref:hypothetical protein n=1 Tax=Sulfitobacter sp. TBRI5 TaxID=2989732 RepID=UPI003A6549B3